MGFGRNFAKKAFTSAMAGLAAAGTFFPDMAQAQNNAQNAKPNADLVARTEPRSDAGTKSKPEEKSLLRQAGEASKEKPQISILIWKGTEEEKTAKGEILTGEKIGNKLADIIHGLNPSIPTQVFTEPYDGKHSQAVFFVNNHMVMDGTSGAAMKGAAVVAVRDFEIFHRIHLKEQGIKAEGPTPP